jgi:hypothetical protein
MFIYDYHYPFPSHLAAAGARPGCPAPGISPAGWMGWPPGLPATGGLPGKGKNARDFGEIAPETGRFVENSTPFVNLTQKPPIWAFCS